MSLIGMSVDPLTVDVPGAATAGPPPDPAAALAAGYLELRRTLAAGAGAADGGAARRFSREMRDWHRLLLTPSVAAGHLAADSAGELRRHARFRRASPHTPPRHEAMRDLLPVLFELLQAEADVRVGAVLGHWLLTLLAPFEHGNRLLALALSRHLLAEAGAARIAATAAAYRSALESAWIEDDPRALTRLLGGGGD